MLNASTALKTKGRIVNSKKVVIHGPFVEARNVVRGYVNVEADTLDTAAELAKGRPVLLHGGVVEVRPFWEGVPGNLPLFGNVNEGGKAMNYIVALSRILLGLIFVVFGLNGFLHFIPTAQFPGVAEQFIGAIFASHFYIVVFLTQIVGSLPLLANRYVPFGLLVLGPVLVNILSFHISCPQPISRWHF